MSLPYGDHHDTETVLSSVLLNPKLRDTQSGFTHVCYEGVSKERNIKMSVSVFEWESSPGVVFCIYSVHLCRCTAHLSLEVFGKDSETS